MKFQVSRIRFLNLSKLPLVQGSLFFKGKPLSKDYSIVASSSGFVKLMSSSLDAFPFFKYYSIHDLFYEGLSFFRGLLFYDSLSRGLLFQGFSHSWPLFSCTYPFLEVVLFYSLFLIRGLHRGSSIYIFFFKVLPLFRGSSIHGQLFRGLYFSRVLFFYGLVFKGFPFARFLHLWSLFQRPPHYRSSSIYIFLFKGFSFKEALLLMAHYPGAFPFQRFFHFMAYCLKASLLEGFFNTCPLLLGPPFSGVFVLMTSIKASPFKGFFYS